MECLRPLVIACLTLVCLTAKAATYYVTPSGAGAADGSSLANAWSLATALSSSGNGDTMLLGDGTYSHIGPITKHFQVWRAINKWQAVVVGGSGAHGIYSNDGYHTNTIDGIKINSAYLSGIKMNGHGWTITDNWVRQAGRGDPMWVTNSSGTYTGNGIESHNYSGHLIERNRITENGAKVTQDHGMYLNGTNLVIRGNFVMSNCAWGIQLYHASPQDVDNALVENNIVVDNGTPGVYQSGLVLYTWGDKTNIIRNNIILCGNNGYAISLTGASATSVAAITNNILESISWADEITDNTMTALVNYNLRSKAPGGDPTGANDVITNNFRFVSASTRLYYPSSTSAARGMALTTGGPATNWYGVAQASVSDVGAYQYDVLNDADTRSFLTGEDPWLARATFSDVVIGLGNHVSTWTEAGAQHAGAQVWRKAGSGGSYAAVGGVAAAVLTQSDSTSGLVDGTTYYYKVALTNAAGRGVYSAEDSILMYNYPGLSSHSIQSTSVSSNSARISWATSESATSQVTYNGTSTATDTTLVRYHAITLSGLTPSTAYNYTVTSTNTTGSITSGTNTFTTLAVGYTTVSTNRFSGGGIGL